MTAQLPGEMLRVELPEPGRLEIRQVPVPRPGPGEVLVKVVVALTCGTELKLYRRGHSRISLPTPLGHEFSGVVAASGSGVENFQEGDAIACVPTVPCGSCTWCARGQENLCPDAVSRMVFGAFGEYVCIPARVVRSNMFLRPPGLAADAASLLEPLSCVLHGMDRTDPDRRRGRILLLGDGPISLLFLQVCRWLDLGPVLVAGKHPLRLETARNLGADQVVGPSDGSLRDRVLEWGRGRLPELVVECVGTPQAWELAISLAEAGGQVLLFGGCAPGTSMNVATDRIHYEEVDVLGAFHYRPTDVRKALELLENGAVQASPMITHRMPLERIEEAFRLVLARQAIKVALEPWG